MMGLVLEEQAIHSNSIDALDWLADQGYLPSSHYLDRDIQMPDIKYNRIQVLEWLEAHKVDISRNEINRAIRTYEISTLEYLYQKGIVPNINDVLNSNIPNTGLIFDWLESKGILPSTRDASNALINGNFRDLDWMLGKGIIPSYDVIQDIVEYGDIDTINWLITKHILLEE